MVYTQVTETNGSEAAWLIGEQRYGVSRSGANEGVGELGDEVDGVYASQRLHEIVGLQSQQASIPTDLWLARIHPDDVDEMRERMREHLRGNTEYYDHEYRMRGDDGSYRWVHSRGLGVRDDTGRVYRMAGSLSDITEPKTAEHELLRA